MCHGTDAAVAKWRAEAHRTPLLILELGIGTAQRTGDLVRMTWADYDGAAITVTQSKTGTALTNPVTAPLKAALAAERTRVTPHPSRTILAQPNGRPISIAYLSRVMRAERERLGTLEHDQHAMRYRPCEELARAG